MSRDDLIATDLLYANHLYNTDTNFTDLHTAVKNNNINLVECIISEGTIPIDSQTENGNTSLLFACCLAVDTLIVEKLIQSSSDVNISNNEDFTPLLAACKAQKVEVVQLLLEKGANVNHQDKHKFSALHYAAADENIELVKLLLRYRIDPNLANNDGWSPLMFAVSSNNKHFVELLVENGSEVHIFVDEMMPVVLAAQQGDFHIFNYLWSPETIEVLKKNNSLERFIKFLILKCLEDLSRMSYLYNVLDTPGMQLDGTRHYIRKVANFMASKCETFEENQAIDVINIARKLVERGAKFSELDVEGLLSISCFYDLETKYELLKLFIESGANFNNIQFIYMASNNDPELTMSIIQYWVCGSPSDLLKNFFTIMRTDASELKLLKYLLKICTPSRKVKKIIRIYLEKDLVEPNMKIFYALMELSGYRLFPFDSAYENLYEESQIRQEISELLSINKVPFLQELARDKIRKCLAKNCLTTQDYLYNLETLHLPKCLTDIIQCKVL